MYNQDFLAQFGQDLDFGDRKASSNSLSGGDILSSLLSVNKQKA